MPQDINIENLIINRLTKEKYTELKNSQSLSANELYVVTDDEHFTLTEIQNLLSTKQDILQASGKITISEENIITVDLSEYYTKQNVDTLLQQTKDDLNEGISNTGAKLEYTDSVLSLQTKTGKNLSSVTIKSAPEVDNQTINYNSNSQLQSIGEISKNSVITFDWIGTQEQYNTDLQSGIIDQTTKCFITDDISDNIIYEVIYIPALTKVDGGYELSWSNQQGYENPSTVLLQDVRSIQQNYSDINSSEIILKNNIISYNYTPNADATISFNISELNIEDNNFVQFNLKINLTQIHNISFSNEIKWQGNTSPEFNEIGIYILNLISYDKGVTWYGKLDGIWSV